MGILGGIWSGLQWLAGLILPVFAKACDWQGTRPLLRWTLHFLLLAGILVGLWFLNYTFDLARLLRAPWVILRQVWLPLLFLLVYLSSWMAWWLWRLLGPDSEGSDFPDLDAAWQEATRALERAGIDMTRQPVFLVLGRPASPEDSLFHAGRLHLEVPQTPRGAGAPLHVYATADAVWVTCAGASLLGRQAAALAGEGEAETPVSREANPPPELAPDEPLSTLPPPRGQLGSSASLVSPTKDLPVNPEPAPSEPPASPQPEAAHPPARRPSARPRSFLLKDPMQAELLTARLRHLCRLLARQRRPYCPINGILVAVPIAAAANDVDADQTGTIIRQDLATIAQEFQLHCPLFVLVCDLEQLPGFRDFVDRFPEEKRERRIGRQFPYDTDRSSAAMTTMIDKGVSWICHDLIPPLVYRLLRLATPDSGRAPTGSRGNARLYQMLHAIREREKRLSRLLLRALTPDACGHYLLGGCYLAGTGRVAEHEQAFAAGVFQRLLEDQNFVAWSLGALSQEVTLKRRTRLGYLFLTFTVLAVLVFLWFF